MTSQPSREPENVTVKIVAGVRLRDGKTVKNLVVVRPSQHAEHGETVSLPPDLAAELIGAGRAVRATKAK